MAIVLVLHSVVIEDADGERFALPLYETFDDSTATLSSLAAAWSAEVALVDGVTDGKIVKHSVTMFPALPGGLKSDAVAGSEVEKTGLYTFTVSGTPYAHSIDVPASKVAAFVGNVINQADSDVSDFIDSVVGTGGTLRNVEPISQYGLGAIRTAVKTFRKHRRTTKRG